MKKLENFIFIHDQEIILDFIKKNRFHNLEDFKWVFLGSKPIDKVSDLKNLIIVRDLEINIEQYPKFTSFTGWYALHKNGLLNSEYVNLFEYDIHYIDDFIEINKEILKKNPDFVGYFPMLIGDPVYTLMPQYSIELIESVRTKTGFDIPGMLSKMHPNALWSSSSNSTWKVSALIEYIEWFSQFIDDIKNSEYCGHMHERSLSFYYFMKNLKVEMTHNLMIHVQLNSHGTSPLPPERAKKMYELLK